jgi:polyisoprenoid-binding protein YceI
MALETWNFDSSHPGIAKVRGQFARWGGSIAVAGGHRVDLEIDIEAVRQAEAKTA